MPTWLIIFSFGLAINVSAQTCKTDSLKKKLPALNDRARVDCLNALGWEYNFNFIHSDSALKYSKLAWQYASAIQ
jgi:hypothetical protein